MGIDMGTEMGMDMGTEKLELKLEWDTSRNSLFLCVQQLLSNIVSLFAVLLC
jgi:phage tail tube protein FII